MRRRDRELTVKADLEEILRKAFVCHLGLVDGDQPYVVPVNFAYEDGHIYLHGAAEGRKLDLIRKNNKVCFEMELFSSEIIKNDGQPCNWGTAFQSVIGTGTAKIVEDQEEKIKDLNIIVKRFSNGEGGFTFPESELVNTAVIDITITEMSGKAAHN